VYVPAVDGAVHSVATAVDAFPFVFVYPPAHVAVFDALNVELVVATAGVVEEKLPPVAEKATAVDTAA
jgi:hypothetical protein